MARILNKKDYVSKLAQQKLAELLLLQLAACSLKVFYAHQTRSSAQIFNLVETTHETEFTTVDFVILKVVRNEN